MAHASTTKSVIVTGASRGIGRAVATRLARDGFAVAVNYAGNAAKADEVVAEIKAAGGQTIAVQADVANAADVDRLFKEAVDTFGGINVVVNCAGIMPLSPIAGGDLDLFDKVITTNLRGTFVVLGQASRQVSEGGRIIAFSSSVIAKAFPTYGPYIASKAGVEGLVRVLANELRGRNITVNAVAPGPVATELFLTGKEEAQIEQLANSLHWNASASQKILPTWCHSLQAPTEAGSTVRSCVPMVALRNAFQLMAQPIHEKLKVQAQELGFVCCLLQSSQRTSSNR